MGEIGFPRREFLHELRWWEILSIIRGYRKRNHLTHQLIAECAYAAIYTMRDPKGKTVKDVFPALFADEEEYHEPLDEQDRNELVGLMNSINSQNEKSTEA